MVSSTLSKALLAVAVGASAVAAECTFTWEAGSGETCEDMAAAWAVPLDKFITWNPSIGADCENGLEEGTEYCVEWDFGVGDDDETTTTTTTSTPATTTTPPTTTTTTDPNAPSPTQSGLISTCTKFHLVESGDTCDTIVQKYGGTFSLDDFYEWNPAVGSACAGLWLENWVCIAIPGTPTAPVTTTTTTPNPNAPSPTQEGLISTCTTFYKVVSGDTCDTIVAKYKTFTVADFLSWNPAAGEACNIWLDFFVCVGVPGTPTEPTTTTAPGGSAPDPTQTGITSKCNKYYTVASGDTCDKILSKYDNTFSQATFYSWNPATGEDCTSLWVGFAVCVGTTDALPPVAPTPTQAGIPSSCNKWYQAKSGDICEAIVSKNSGLTLSNFYKWNPAVGDTCSGLWLGYFYCIGVQ